MELEGRSYRCKFCRTHLALADDLISRVLYLTLCLLLCYSAYVFESVSQLRTLPFRAYSIFRQQINRFMDIFICWNMNTTCLIEL